MRNFYKVLGIRATADDRRIKSAFRRRAKSVHPDLNPGKVRAEERFRELAEAYKVLCNAELRASYDAFLARRRSEAKRRFVQSASLMAATFTLTLVTGYAFVGLQAQNAPLWGWQVTVTSLPDTETRTSSVVSRTTNVAPQVATTVVVGAAPVSSVATPRRAASAASVEARQDAESARTHSKRLAAADTRTPSETPSSAPNRRTEPVTAARPQRRPAEEERAETAVRQVANSVAEPGWPGPSATDAPAFGLGASGLQ